MPEPLLRVEDLRVSFPTALGEVTAVRGVSFQVGEGEAVALVGESGCGKSATAAALLGLTPKPGRVTGESVRVSGRETLAHRGGKPESLRGREIGMVFQEPMTSLDPVFTIGFQLAEALRVRGSRPALEIRSRSVELLTSVGIADAEQRLRAYPSELSGGLRQRAMIAIALAGDPKLLVADEPTTALDVTVQAQVMSLIGRLRRERRMALLLITHDLGLVAQHVERVLVMYAGHVVEEAPTEELFRRPLHPYTRGLLGSMPGMAQKAGAAGRRVRLQAIAGNVPHPSRVPPGCPFCDRCEEAVSACAEGLPGLELKAPYHFARCLRVGSGV